MFTLQPRDFKQTSLREAWVCPSTHGYTGLLCRCDVFQAEQVRGRFRLQLALPLQFKDSLSLFNEAYDDVARREAAGDVALAVFFFAAAWTLSGGMLALRDQQAPAPVPAFVLTTEGGDPADLARVFAEVNAPRFLGMGGG